MPDRQTTPESRVLAAWARLATGRPGLVAAACLGLAAGAAWLGVRGLAIDTDQDNLVSSSADYYLRYKRDYLGNFADSEYLYAVIEMGGDRDRALAFAEDFSVRARPVPGVVSAVYRFDLDLVADHPLHLMELHDFYTARRRLLPRSDLLRVMAEAEDLAAVFDGLRESFARREQTGGSGALGPPLDLLWALLDDLESVLDRPVGESLENVAFRSVFPGLEGPRALVLHDGDPWSDPEGEEARFVFVAIQTVKDYSSLEVISEPLAGLRRALEETRAAFPEIEAGLTGRPVLAADEMAVSSRDMARATGVAFMLVALVFCLVYRSVLRPALVMAGLLVALAWTLGAAALLVGSLNLLSMVFGIVLVAVGVDFGIHLLARYSEGLSDGLDARGSLFRSFGTAGRANVTAALTTAAAFFAVALADFRGLRELGLITGVGVVLCWVSMHTFLPAALLLVDGRRGGRSKDRRVRAPLQLRALADLDAHRLPLGVLAVALTLLSLWSARDLTLDRDLLALQDPNLPSVQWERRIAERSEFSTWFGVFLVDDTVQAGYVVDKVRTDTTGELGRVESLIHLLPPFDRQSQAEVFAGELTGDRGVPEPGSLAGDPLRPERLAQALEDSAEWLRGHRQRLAAQGAPEAATRLFDDLAARLGSDAGRVRGADEDAETLEAISEYRRRLLGETHRYVRALITAPPMTAADLPTELRERYLGRDGRLAVLVFPRHDPWEPEALERFASALVAVDPEVTGVPIMVQRSVEAMEEGFYRALLYALIAVVVLLALDFRRPRWVLLALVPTVVGLGWAAGLASALEIHLNLANFYAVPMLLGIAVDNGVHLAHRWRLEPDRNAAAGVTGIAVTLTGLTTLIGFGSLSFSRHPGLASLGLVLAIGAAACVLVSLIVLPILVGRSSHPSR